MNLCKLIFGVSITFAMALCLVSEARRAVGADAAKSRTSTGPIRFHGTHFTAVPGAAGRFNLDLTDGFTIASGDYDVSGSTAHIESAHGGGLPRVVAKGDSGKQVSVIFKNTSEGMRLRFVADQAVLDADSARPGGSKVTFTGSVTMYVASPVALENESKTTMATAIVLVGKGPGYPRIEATDVTGTATPAPAH